MSILVIGEALVDFVPLHPGPLRLTEGFEVHSGGAPGNVATVASLLGGQVAFAGVVGDDEFGELLRHRFEQAGVDVSGLRMTDESLTGLCFITLDEHGERSFSHRGGDAAALLAPQDIHERQVSAARVVKFSVGSLRTAEGEAAIDRLTTLADTHGALICCDPGKAPPHWADPAVISERLSRMLRRCAVIKCALDETEMLTGEQDPHAAAQRLIEQGAELAIVTLGGEGALWRRAHDQGRVQTPPVEVVDTTGAGDAFMAALLVRLAADEVRPAALSAEVLDQHLRYACEIGAAAVTCRGAIAGIQRLTR